MPEVYTWARRVGSGTNFTKECIPHCAIKIDGDFGCTGRVDFDGRCPERAVGAQSLPVPGCPSLHVAYTVDGKHGPGSGRILVWKGKVSRSRQYVVGECTLEGRPHGPKGGCFIDFGTCPVTRKLKGSASVSEDTEDVVESDEVDE
jgi:hypothetical protein